MSLPPNHQPQSGRAAVAVGAPRKRKAGWIILALLLLAALILLLSRCGNGDDTTAASGASSSASSDASSSAESSPSTTASSTATSSTAAPTTSTATTAPAPAGAGAGVLTVAGGAALLPLNAAAPDGGLAASTGQEITATGVTVESVPADEGFWVGDSATDRVWVQLNLNTESPFEVTAGQKVSFAGPLTPHDASFAESAGVTEDEGAAQLTAQAQHIAIDASTLTEQG